MPHIIREEHLEDICAQCKKPHGNNFTIQVNHHNIYELITCKNCGYEIVRVVSEEEFSNKFEMSHKIGIMKMK